LKRFHDAETRAAAYFCLIIKDHVVTDGNKRLATLWLQIYTQALELSIRSQMGLDVLAVSVENEKTMTLEELVQAVKFILF
jgi:prophage maintenance system killer protein